MTLSHDDAATLAGGLTALLAVPVAIAAFFGERSLSARGRQERAKVAWLAALTIAGVYAAICAGLGWWAWLQATSPSDHLLWGVSRDVWFAALFAPTLLFAGVCAAGGIAGLLVAAYRSLQRTPP